MCYYGNQNFTCVDIGSHGNQSDGGVFAKSNLIKAIENNKLEIPPGSVILSDETFLVKSYLMKPHPDKFQQTAKEKVYN